MVHRAARPKFDVIMMVFVGLAAFCAHGRVDEGAYIQRLLLLVRLSLNMICVYSMNKSIDSNSVHWHKEYEYSLTGRIAP